MRYVQGALAGIDVTGMDVVEIGSVDVNGSVRPLFRQAASYVGIDVRPGRGVDLVADGATWQPAGPVDLVVSTEMLEHAPEQAQVIANVARMLKPGGVFILTAAGVERKPHSNDGHVGNPQGEFYRNVSEADLGDWLEAAGFSVWSIERDTKAGDIYCVAHMPEMAAEEIEDTTPAPARRRPTRKVKISGQ